MVGCNSPCRSWGWRYSLEVYQYHYVYMELDVKITGLKDLDIVEW